MEKLSQTRSESHAAKSVIVVGLGNIGSHLVPLAGRMRGVGRVVLIDHDVYEQRNLSCQDIASADLGRSKAQVQARRLRRINPALDVHPISRRVEDVPLGVLRGDVVMACLDSLSARQSVNQAAWRLGVPWIDAGVDATGLLVRVNAYMPGPDNPCIECAWAQEDYAALEQSYPCQPEGVPAQATNAPASLGAVAAGLMALECQKLLGGDFEHLLGAREVFIDLQHHVHDVTVFRRNPNCRFDHATWRIEPLRASPRELSLRKLLESAPGAQGDARQGSLRLERQPFACRLFCRQCGKSVQHLHLKSRIRRVRRQCPTCGRPMMVRGIDLREEIEGGRLSARQLGRSLHGLGIRPQDVLTIGGPGGDRHLEVVSRS